MHDVLISQFIDDELDLAEKITFVESVQSNESFAGEVLVLLDQEMLMLEAADAAAIEPEKTVGSLFPVLNRWKQSVPIFAAVLLLVFLAFVYPLQRVETGAQRQAHRFVLYRPQALQASVIGSFTGWSSVPMEKAGSSGYWTLTLDIPPGEHRYTFLVDRSRQVADPTTTAREVDDFGGVNSILILGDDDEPLS